MSGVIRSLRATVDHVINPRQHTDRQSEILNLVAGPIYVYTITTVVYYGVFQVLPYYYGNVEIVDTGNGLDFREIDPENWTLFLQRCLAILIYIQMMSNWMNIRYVQNKPNRLITGVANCDHDQNSNLSNVVVSPGNHGNRNGKKSKGVIPGPISAPSKPPRKSYWSWKTCDKCNMNNPPRCHHCPMCATCILKRDHHCFFAGKCVGFYNQRHFIVFLMWAAFGTSYATIYYIHFLFKVLLPYNSYLDIFPPFALLRWLLGYGNFQATNYVFAFLFNGFFVPLSSHFLYEQYNLISEGLTQFEKTKVNRNRLTITDPRPMADKIRAVMGYNYGLSIIFPLTHLFILPHENPYEWPEHKIYKH